MIKAIYWDFDGVLTTDATGTTTIINYMKSRRDMDSASFEKAYRKHNSNLLYGKTTHEDVWPLICGELGRSFDFDILIQSFLSTPMDERILNLAEQFKQEGYFIGIITDNKKDRIDRIFTNSEYHSIFDRIVVSSEIGSGKQERDIFEAAVSGTGFHFHECIFVDNSRKNLIVPQQLGMHTIFFDHVKRNHESLDNEIKEILYISKV